MINLYLPSSDLPEKQWRISLALAIGLHFLVFLIALLSPYILQFRRPLPEIYTVNLFSVEDTSAPLAAPQSKAVITPSETKTKKQVESKPAPAPAPAPVPKSEPQAVSLKPIKSKNKSDQDQVNKLREKLLAQEQAKKAREDAEKTAQDALEKLKESLFTQNQLSKVDGTSTADAASAVPRGGSGVTVDENTRRYLLAITNQIQEHWKIPLYQNWDPSLEVRAILTVRKDGIVTKTDFVHKSNNIYFNQFVEKTIKNATPLPPFPIGITDSQMEIGLRFTLKGLL